MNDKKIYYKINRSKKYFDQFFSTNRSFNNFKKKIIYKNVILRLNFIVIIVTM